MYPVYSPLLLSASCSSSWGSSIAGTAVSYAFTVVRNIAKRKAASTTDNSPAPSYGDVGRPITVPSWLGAVDPVGNDDSLAPQRGVAYILCDDQVMDQLQLAEVLALSNVYGQFFNHLHSTARRLGKASVPMLYSKYTPPTVITGAEQSHFKQGDH